MLPHIAQQRRKQGGRHAQALSDSCCRARRAVSPFRERDDWLAGSEHMADVNLESPFATNAFVDRARRIAAALPHSARL
jgi:hypothetical protein